MAVPSAVKILAYVHTYNDAEAIDGTIQALCEQTCPIPEILLVDNASTDGTLERDFPSKVTIIRNAQNLGTSGAVAIGMEYGLSHGYDWIYILDADSAPAADAIDRLLQRYQSLSPELQSSTWWLSSLLKEARSGRTYYGCNFTPRGIEYLPPQPEPYYQCHANMWSGSLYRLDAVKSVHLPNSDYVLDYGDLIYGYEGMLRGYTGFLDQTSIVLHNLHADELLHIRRIGPRLVRILHFAPIRSYYFWRNGIYFWLYKYDTPDRAKLVVGQIFMFLKSLIKVSLFVESPGPILRACLRGMWDGLHARLERRY